MKSLFLVSLPRSLSTQTYHLLGRALGLEEPSWTSDGEILNLDRYTLFPGKAGAECRKFIDQRHEPQRFQQVVDFLRQATVPDGFIYKDVVQPFAISSWLPGSGMKVLRIVRSLADVAYAMIERGWLYPGNAASLASDLEGSLIEGLVRARQALCVLPATTVRFDDFIADEAALWEAVQQLYPGAEVSRHSYIDPAFREVLSEVLQRRQTRKFRQIEAKCEEVLAALES